MGIRPQALQEALKTRGMTAYKLSQRSGVSQSYISRILTGERGVKVSAERLSALARAMDVRVDFLLGDGGPMDVETKNAFGPPLRRLRERDEWYEARKIVLHEHPELSQVDVDAVGELVDDSETFPMRVDASFVHGFAVVFRDWRARSRARR